MFPILCLCLISAVMGWGYGYMRGWQCGWKECEEVRERQQQVDPDSDPFAKGYRYGVVVGKSMAESRRELRVRNTDSSLIHPLDISAD